MKYIIIFAMLLASQFSFSQEDLMRDIEIISPSRPAKNVLSTPARDSLIGIAIWLDNTLMLRVDTCAMIRSAYTETLHDRSSGDDLVLRQAWEKDWLEPAYFLTRQKIYIPKENIINFLRVWPLKYKTE